MGARIPTCSARPAIMAYLRAYQAAHDETPSLGEIANAVGSTKPHVSRALNRLERDGELRRLPAAPRQKRRIVLPEQQARALAMLRELGWSINGDVRSLHGPSVTDWELLGSPGSRQIK